MFDNSFPKWQKWRVALRLLSKYLGGFDIPDGRGRYSMPMSCHGFSE
jgi:hypothetical protein